MATQPRWSDIPPKWPEGQRPKCTAKSKRTGEPCGRYAADGYRVCKHHGAGGGRPPTTYNYARYDRILPERLLDRYKESQHDPNLLAMDQEIRIIDARIGECFSLLNEGVNPKVFEEAMDLYKEAMGGGKKGAAAFAALGDTLKNCCRDTQSWQEIVNLILVRQKLSEQEQRRKVRMQQFATAEEVMNFARMVIIAVQRHVPDAKVQSALAAEIAALCNGRGTQPALAELGSYSEDE